MSTAEALSPEELEAKRIEEEQARIQMEIVNWQPPKVPHGSIVLFYKEGKKTANPPIPMVAYNPSRSGRSITLRPLAGGEAKMNVRFANDPRNKTLDDAELARSGVWDFTEEHYLMESIKDGAGSASISEIDDLKSRVASLEKLVRNLSESITQLIQGKVGK